MSPATALTRALVIASDDGSAEVRGDEVAFSIGDRVTVVELGVDATVLKFHADGDLSVRFSDGDEGNYSREEVAR
jgi:hypothetical protein